MSSAADQQALVDKLKARQLANQGVKNPETVTEITPTAAAPKKEPSFLAKAVQTAEGLTPVGMASNLVDTAKQEYDAVSKGGLQSIDDQARVAAGKAGDVTAGVMNGLMSGDPSSIPQNIQQEAQKTLAAKLRLRALGGDELASKVETAGEVGKMVALPGGMFATPLKAAATGGLLEVADTMTDRMARGEPVNDDYMAYVLRGAEGAGTSLVGYHLGKLAGSFINYLGGKLGYDTTKTLTEEAQKLSKANKDLADTATRDLERSGVSIGRNGRAELTKRIDKAVGNTELHPQVTQDAWQGYQMLRQRLTQKEPISLENLSGMLDKMRSLPYDDHGLLKSTTTVASRDLKVLNSINDTVESFVQGLTGTRHFVIGGGGGALEKGLNAWGKMNDLNKKVFRTDRIMELIANAESAARGGDVSFENALQGQFASLWKKKEFVERIFTPQQQKELKAIAEGDFSKRFFNRLDRIMGSTIFSPATRLLQSSFGSLFEAEESRQAARALVNNTAGQFAKAKVLPEAGSKAALYGLDQKLK
jgi:hypothetical protein